MTTHIERLKAHALKNYEHPDERWDVIVECWEDKDIQEVFDSFPSYEEAFEHFRSLCSVWADQYKYQHH